MCRDNCEQALTDAESAGCGAEADALSSCITDTDYSCDLDGGFSSLGACVIETADGCATQADLEGGPTRDNVCRSENAALAECTKGTE